VWLGLAVTPPLGAGHNAFIPRPEETLDAGDEAVVARQQSAVCDRVP